MTNNTAPLIKISDLSKSYGSKCALAGVNIELGGGRIIGLLGPNGSGKTTLIKLLCGILTPTSGEILIKGNRPGVESKKLVAYLPERTYLDNNLRVSETLDFFGDFYENFQRDRAETMLSHLNIDPSAKLKTLSKGTKEKIQLILVMSRNADIYLLDEPIGGVDPAARDYILDTIIKNYNPDSTIIISTHLIADVERVLDDVIFISGGIIKLRSTVDDIRESHNMSVDGYFREVFKC